MLCCLVLYSQRVTIKIVLFFSFALLFMKRLCTLKIVIGFLWPSYWVWSALKGWVFDSTTLCLSAYAMADTLHHALTAPKFSSDMACSHTTVFVGLFLEKAGAILICAQHLKQNRSSVKVCCVSDWMHGCNTMDSHLTCLYCCLYPMFHSPSKLRLLAKSPAVNSKIPTHLRIPSPPDTDCSELPSD